MKSNIGSDQLNVNQPLDTQLPRLNRILAFEDLGLSLERITQLLDDDRLCALHFSHSPG